MDVPKIASQQGQYLGPPTDERGFIPKQRIPLDRAESLAVMQQDYAFFTPAALYVKSSFTDAPLVDYMVSMGEDVPLFHYKFNRPLFGGLNSRSGDVGWNHVLWAVPLPYWDSLRDFLCSLTIADRSTATVVRYGVQEVPILDPVAVDRLTVLDTTLPSVTVYTLGIYGNRFQARFIASPTLQTPPALTFFLPAQDMVVYAKAWFSGKNPILERELFLSRQKAKSDESQT